MKKIGETADMGNVDAGDSVTMKFKVTSIKAVTCDAPYAAAPKGQAIAVAMEIETTQCLPAAVHRSGSV